MSVEMFGYDQPPLYKDLVMPIPRRGDQTCEKCGEVKPIKNFYAPLSICRPLLGWCMECIHKLTGLHEYEQRKKELAEEWKERERRMAEAAIHDAMEDAARDIQWDSLRLVRKGILKMNQKEMAEVLGTSQTYVSFVESGERNIPEKWVKILKPWCQKALNAA